MISLTTIRDNERSWAIRLISDINIFLQSTTLTIKRAGGEIGVSTKNNTLFPDLVLYGNESQTQILQGWELKMPDIPITDTEFIANAEKKARILHMNSFVLWNFKTGCMYVLDENDNYVVAKTWNPNTVIKTRNDVALYYNEWFETIKQMLIEIDEYITDGKITSSDLGFILSENIMTSIITDNKLIVAEHLKAKAISDSVMKSRLEVWWNNIKSEYIHDEKDMYSAYAKVLLLNWTNRIVFAHLIKKYHPTARLINTIDHETTINDALSIFEQITKSCDFFNVFHPLKYSKEIPNSTWKQIVELSIFLSKNGLKFISQTALQSILEKSVQTMKREIHGQYTTPPVLAYILTKVAVNNWNQHCIDPCCGTGTIAKTILKIKKDNIGLKKAYKTTWASDKYTFPLQITNISMVDANAMNIPCLIFPANALNIEPESLVNVINPNNGSMMELHLPKFGAIVSNLPFVAFEVIEKDERNFINSIINKVNKECSIQLSGKSDLYSFIILSLWNLLSNNGRLGVIISNSWLATDWGINFRKALMMYFDIQQVVISGAGKWFKNADVVTTILILKKKSKIQKQSDETHISFAVLKTPLENLKKTKIDTIINSLILKQELDTSLVEMTSYSVPEIRKLNVNLNVSWNALFYKINWLTDISDRLCPLNSLFKVFRGSRRGWDSLFFPQKPHKIEPQYIHKGIKSSRDIQSLIVKANDDVFCCSKSKDELKFLKHFNAISWIEKFENETNTKGIPLPIKLYNERNKTYEKYWYELSPKYSIADLVSTINPDKRLFIARTTEPSFINQRLIGMKAISPKIDIELCHALMNSILGMFYIEAIGFGRGLGALDLSKKRFERMMILNPSLLSKHAIEEIKSAFKPLLKRPILTTKKEINQEDRKQFDKTVLRFYGIDQYYDSIKDSLLAMQSARLSVK